MFMYVSFTHSVRRVERIGSLLRRIHSPPGAVAIFTRPEATLPQPRKSFSSTYTYVQPVRLSEVYCRNVRSEFPLHYFILRRLHPNLSSVRNVLRPLPCGRS